MLKCWLDGIGFNQNFLDFDKHSGIPPGMDWEQTLYSEVARADAVVVVLTRSWIESKWCFVEFAQARALGKQIYILRTEDIDDRTIGGDIQQLDYVSDPEGALERLLISLRELSLETQGGFAWSAGRPPFPGLTAFQEEDAPVFFGRSAERRRLVEILNSKRTLGGARLIAILGASGSGKSSLLRAGVLPHIRRDLKNWIVVPPFRPQDLPVQELARSLASASGAALEWDRLHDDLIGPSTNATLRRVAGNIRAAANANEANILISIDQAEELFTTADADEAERFFELLNWMLTERTPFIVILTMRSDYLSALQANPTLTVEFENFPIRPIPQEQMREVIEGPAGVADLEIEPALVDRAIADAQNQDALPLLAFAMRELFERFGRNQRLTLDEYLRLGDTASGLNPLENAVRNVAERVLSSMQLGEPELRALRDAFIPGMARINDENEFVRRPARWDSLPDLAKPIFDRLTDARLLVKREEGSGTFIEVAHEALLRKWPLLREWLDSDRSYLAWVENVGDEISRWERAAPRHRRDLLLRGWPLNQSLSWLVTRRIDPKSRILEFVERSFLAGFYTRLTFAALLALALPSIVVGYGEQAAADAFRSVDWLRDPVSRFLLESPNLLWAIDLAAFAGLLMICAASAIRFLSHAYERPRRQEQEDGE